MRSNYRLTGIVFRVVISETILNGKLHGDSPVSIAKSAISEIEMGSAVKTSASRMFVTRNTVQPVRIATFCDARHTVAILFYASTRIRTILGNQQFRKAVTHARLALDSHRSISSSL